MRRAKARRAAPKRHPTVAAYDFSWSIPRIFLRCRGLGPGAACELDSHGRAGPAPPGSTVLVKAAGKSSRAGTCIRPPRRPAFPPRFRLGPRCGGRKHAPAAAAAQARLRSQFRLRNRDLRGRRGFPAGSEAEEGCAGGRRRNWQLQGRYQTCNDTQCVPSRWAGTAAADRRPAPPPRPRSPFPPGTRRPRRRRRSAPPARRPRPGAGGFSAGGLRLRAGLHLHALRLSHDPDHHVVFPEPAGGRAARGHDAGGGVLPGNHRAVFRLGPGHHRAAGAVRGGAVGVESLGQRVHRGAVHRLRAEPAGGVRDHHSLGRF